MWFSFLLLALTLLFSLKLSPRALSKKRFVLFMVTLDGERLIYDRLQECWRKYDDVKCLALSEDKLIPRHYERLSRLTPFAHQISVNEHIRASVDESNRQYRT